MSELQKIESFRYALAVAETFEEIKLMDSASAAMAELARKEKVSLEKQNEIGLFRIEVMEKVAQWLEEKHPSNKASNQYVVGKIDQPSKMPVSKEESSNSRLVAREPELKEEVVAEIVQSGDVITPNKVANGIRQKMKSNISIRPSYQPEDISPNHLTIEDFIETEAEVEEQKETTPKVRRLEIINLPMNHEDVEIRTISSMLYHTDHFKTLTDFKTFLKRLLTSKLEEYEN